MRVTVLTLPTTKVSLLLLATIALHGCSTKLRKGPTQKIKTLPQKTIVNYGPTPPPGTTSKLFEERSRQYGLEGVRGVRFYAIDFDRDGWTDLAILPDYFSTPEFYHFSPQTKRFERLGYSPLGEDTQGSFLNFADLDGDGSLDVLLGTLVQKSELTKKSLRIFRGSIKSGRLRYEEIPNPFSPNVRKRLLNFPLSSLSLLDFDLDGKLDLFLGGWFYHGPKGEVTNAPDILLKGEGFKFQDTSSLLSNEDASRAAPTFASATCDIDLDGYPDILTASSNGHPNKLWLNQQNTSDGQGSGRLFRDFGAESGYAQDHEGRLQLRGGGHSFFSSCADYNNDSLMDIFLGELFHAHDPKTVDLSSILTGKNLETPQFIRTPYTNDEQRRWSQGDRRGVWLDYNVDGLTDLLVDNSGFPPRSRLVLFHQNPDHSYEDRAPRAGIDLVNPVGSITLDVNRDGRPDILVGQDRVRDARIRPRLYLFENAIPREGRRSVRFYLRGQTSNARGIGSLVTLETSKGKKRQWVEYHQGPQASQNQEGIQFGLAKGEAPLKVSVHWPYWKGAGRPTVAGEARQRQPSEKTVYSLSRYKFRHFLSLTLHENGKTSLNKDI